MALAAPSERVPDLLTVAEAAGLAGVHRATVHSWCARGLVPSVRDGPHGHRRIRQRDLERWLRERDRPVRARSVALRVVGRTPQRSLQRLATELAGADDLDRLFEDVLENTTRLFLSDRAGLWLWSPSEEHPLSLAAGRGVPNEVIRTVESATIDSDLAGVRALLADEITTFDDIGSAGITPEMRRAYARAGIHALTFIPASFRGDPLALIVLYHRESQAWAEPDLALARSFGDTVALAIGNTRLLASVADLAARLRGVQDLSERLSGVQDVRGIGEAIVAEAGELLDYQTIRVYRVDHETGWCEPIAFEGTFMGSRHPSAEMLRLRIGEGLTGWVAAHGRTLVTGDAHADARSIVIGEVSGPESMLAVPMTYEGRVRGVVVTSRLGSNRFGPQDETTLSIFAGAAVQALVNAERLDQLRTQQEELEHQLVSQRRLMAINEQLLSTLDPAGVLETIADSLKSVVAYDSLTIYRADFERGVRRPVIARDRFAEVILNYEAPLDTGLTGWAVDHRQPVLANDAHIDPRSIQIPGTPFEPESMVVVPLMAEGEVLGTLNIGRMGEAGAHFSQNEFELTKLFAAQAAIALRNAETHDEVRVQAERDALTGLRNHGAFQRELQAYLGVEDAWPVALLMMDLDRFKGFNDRNGHPAGDELLVAVGRAIEDCVRHGDHAYRYGGDEFAVILPECGRAAAEEVARRIAEAVEEIPDESGGPHVTISIGIACCPDDATEKDALVEIADQALFLAKGAPFRSSRDQFVAALDETAMGLLDGLRPEQLLDAILMRAARLLGVRTGYVYLAEPGDAALTVRAGIGLMADYVGYRLPIDQGISGHVFRTREPVIVDDYDRFDRAAPDFIGRVGAAVAVPLTVGGRVVGVLGLASGAKERVFRQPESDALQRFAQLASMALENAQLHAQQASEPRDSVTGLPTRETMLQRVVDALAQPAAGQPRRPLAVVLLDVDRFQIVNESLGHAMGDRVLREVGRRIHGVLREGQLVARFGGDTFGIVLPDTDSDAALALAERVQQGLRAPFDLDGRTWFISASMGVAVGSPGATGAGDLLQEAEIALVGTKRHPARRVALFDPLSSRHARQRLDVEAELWAAIDRSELVPHYQPIIDLRTQEVVGFEALARWQHPGRGLVLPVDFIALAEESDLIVAIGRVILEKACRQARAWRRRWPERNLVMSVNLSPRQFLDSDLAGSVARALEATGLEASALELEITESSVMDPSESSLRVLQQLRSLGVRIVLDDFGTGYSSLAYLRELPLDMIKIDRSFVTDLDIGDPNVGIVRAVVSLAHGLGINVVAEGIETPEQAHRLRDLGCDLGQGYAWAHPADAIRAAAFLASGVAPAAGQRRSPNSRSRNRKRLTKSR